MSTIQQSILVPIVKEWPVSAISFAEQLSEAYDKRITLLFFNKVLFDNSPYQPKAFITTKSFYHGINDSIKECDHSMVIWETPKKRRDKLTYLKTARNWRIPYFFIPNSYSNNSIKHIIMPITFLIEDREKGVWARSLNRALKTKTTIFMALDKGSRAKKNTQHIASFLNKEHIEYSIINGKRSSFKINIEATTQHTIPTDLLVITASRAYGLDDHLLGPQELKVINKSKIPVMILNPRDDLYVLCGD